jgi:hypothetical protein
MNSEFSARPETFTISDLADEFALLAGGSTVAAYVNSV